MFARFGSPFDFGLARLPGVLDEPWYRHGIFSVYAIPANAWQMLLEPWHRIARPPYFLPEWIRRLHFSQRAISHLYFSNRRAQS